MSSIRFKKLNIEAYKPGKSSIKRFNRIIIVEESKFLNWYIDIFRINILDIIKFEKN